jgi:hypothetical protein
VPTLGGRISNFIGVIDFILTIFGGKKRSSLIRLGVILRVQEFLKTFVTIF